MSFIRMRISNLIMRKNIQNIRMFYSIKRVIDWFLRLIAKIKRMFYSIIRTRFQNLRAHFLIVRIIFN